MDEPNLNERLSRIETMWTVVFRAHQGEADAEAQAKQVLLQRYSRPIYRYLLGALRDADAADELSQDFALRFVRGDFRNANPEKGRFRDFVKKSLFNLIVNYQKKKSGRPMNLAPEMEPAAPSAQEMMTSDEQFLGHWRDELLSRTWDALAEFQEQTGQLYHAVLRFRAEHPDLPSNQMAEQLSAQLGKPLSAAGIRQSLHRAREKFAELLIQEVSHSLETTDEGRIEDELIDLGLFSYCRSAVKGKEK